MKLPVAHALGIGRVEVRHHRIGRPAELFLGLLRAVDDDADGEDVVDALEGHVLLVHLRPDREDRLRAALDVVFHAEAVEPLDVEGEIVKKFAKTNLVYSNTLGEWVTHNGIDIKADKTT